MDNKYSCNRKPADWAYRDLFSLAEVNGFLWLVQTGFASETNCSRVHFTVALLISPHQRLRQALTQTQTNGTQRVKRFRVRFDRTMLGWCERALKHRQWSVAGKNTQMCWFMGYEQWSNFSVWNYCVTGEAFALITHWKHLGGRDGSVALYWWAGTLHRWQLKDLVADLAPSRQTAAADVKHRILVWA